MLMECEVGQSRPRIFSPQTQNRRLRHVTNQEAVPSDFLPAISEPLNKGH